MKFTFLLIICIENALVLEREDIKSFSHVIDQIKSLEKIIISFNPTPKHVPEAVVRVLDSV